MMLHTRFRLPGRWLRYIEQLEAGAVYLPLMHRGEIKGLWETGWIEHPVSWVAPARGAEFLPLAVVGARSGPAAGPAFLTAALGTQAFPKGTLSRFFASKIPS